MQHLSNRLKLRPSARAKVEIAAFCGVNFLFSLTHTLLSGFSSQVLATKRPTEAFIRIHGSACRATDSQWTDSSFILLSLKSTRGRLSDLKKEREGMKKEKKKKEKIFFYSHPPNPKIAWTKCKGISECEEESRPLWKWI